MEKSKDRIELNEKNLLMIFISCSLLICLTNISVAQVIFPNRNVYEQTDSSSIYLFRNAISMINEFEHSISEGKSTDSVLVSTRLMKNGLCYERINIRKNDESNILCSYLYKENIIVYSECLDDNQRISFDSTFVSKNHIKTNNYNEFGELFMTEIHFYDDAGLLTKIVSWGKDTMNKTEYNLLVNTENEFQIKTTRNLELNLHLLSSTKLLNQKIQSITFSIFDGNTLTPKTVTEFKYQSNKLTERVEYRLDGNIKAEIISKTLISYNKLGLISRKQYYNIDPDSGNSELIIGPVISFQYR